MQIRKLMPEDMAAMSRAQSISFMYPLNPDKSDTDEHIYSWGAFDDEGTLISGLLNFPLPIYYDGHTVGMGGVGGVISLPEGRMRGNIRNIFRAVFDEIRGYGGIFSMLFPFSRAYYWKFGYEVCHAAHTYAFPTEQLKAFRQTGEARLHLPGDSDAAFRSIREQYARRYNCAGARTDMAWKWVLSGDPYKCESYRYILAKGGRDVAYCMFRSIKMAEFSYDMVLTEFAFVGPEAFHSLLGFLHKFGAQYENIRFEAPSDLHPAVFLPEAVNLRVTGTQHAMARVVDVEQALQLMRHPGGTGAYRIAIADDFLPENAGTYSVRYGPDGVDVQKGAMDAPCDLHVSVQAFAQLCLGFCALPAALLRPDVKLFENRETLEKVFIEKPRAHLDRY